MAWRNWWRKLTERPPLLPPENQSGEEAQVSDLAFALTSHFAIGIAGAIFFMLSDALIAEHRFVKERSWQPVGIMVTYHAALAGLALGLL